MFTFIRYIEVYFTFAFLDMIVFVRTSFVKSRFVMVRLCSIHFIVSLAGLRKIVCYTESSLYR